MVRPRPLVMLAIRTESSREAPIMIAVKFSCPSAARRLRTFREREVRERRLPLADVLQGLPVILPDRAGRPVVQDKPSPDSNISAWAPLASSLVTTESSRSGEPIQVAEPLHEERHRQARPQPAQPQTPRRLIPAPCSSPRKR
jgi:hypothetical protein